MARGSQRYAGSTRPYPTILLPKSDIGVAAHAPERFSHTAPSGCAPAHDRAGCGRDQGVSERCAGWSEPLFVSRCAINEGDDHWVSKPAAFEFADCSPVSPTSPLPLVCSLAYRLSPTLRRARRRARGRSRGCRGRRGPRPGAKRPRNVGIRLRTPTQAVLKHFPFAAGVRDGVSRGV